ncbi:MAG: hypothetical protein AB4352_02305 [Hormoscilla sp.]
MLEIILHFLTRWDDRAIACYRCQRTWGDRMCPGHGDNNIFPYPETLTDAVPLHFIRWAIAQGIPIPRTGDRAG